jgi:ribulose-phosphate 3-epimerase
MKSRKVRVVPAILTEDVETLEKLVRQAEAFTDFAQLDIMDGEFVPSRSVTYQDMAAVKPGLTWEAHLMVVNPEKYMEGFQQAGAVKVVFHYEATPAPEMVISEIRGLGLQAGLAVNPETPVSAVAALVDKVDSVLFLTVNPGFYGSKFVPEVLDKVAEFRRNYPDKEIGVDGGIKEGNIVQVAGMGVDVIYVGSAISLQPDPAASYRHLLKLAREGAGERT